MDINLLYPFKGNYTLLQRFGEQNFDYSKFGLIGHNGIDWGLPEWTPLYASVDGIIGKIGFEENGYGNFVRINVSNGGKVICAHMSQYTVKLNQKISAGDLIGYSGNTGFSTTPHVHFEYRDGVQSASNGYNGAVDPQPLLDVLVVDNNTNPKPVNDVDNDLATGGNAVVVSQIGANLRDKNMNLLGLIYLNTSVKIIGEPIDFPDNIKRYPVIIEGYLPKDDGRGNTILSK